MRLADGFAPRGSVGRWRNLRIRWRPSVEKHAVCSRERTQHARATPPGQMLVMRIEIRSRSDGNQVIVTFAARHLRDRYVGQRARPLQDRPGDLQILVACETADRV